LRVILLTCPFPLAVFLRQAVALAGFVSAYSGGAAPDFHRLPLSPYIRPFQFFPSTSLYFSALLSIYSLEHFPLSSLTCQQTFVDIYGHQRFLQALCIIRFIWRMLRSNS